MASVNAGTEGTTITNYAQVSTANELDLDSAPNNNPGPTPAEDDEDAVSTLIRSGIEVAVDIKPQPCPNPLNTGDQGLLTVAILGAADFDVTQVDVATVELEGVAPLQSALEDVATPFYPFTGKAATTDCTTAGADGFLDLTLKFDAQAVVAALGSYRRAGAGAGTYRQPDRRYTDRG